MTREQQSNFLDSTAGLLRPKQKPPEHEVDYCLNRSTDHRSHACCVCGWEVEGYCHEVEAAGDEHERLNRQSDD